MKKLKFTALLLAATMLLGGCSLITLRPLEKDEEKKTEPAVVTEEDTEAEPAETQAPPEVFVIYCSDPLSAEFCRQFTAEQKRKDVVFCVVQPGDTPVDWRMLMPEDDGYPDVIVVPDQELQKLAADEIILPLDTIGISDADTEQMYEFMQKFGMVDDVRYGLTWQQTAKMFLYNRTLAEELMEAENGDDVQNELGTWSGFGNMAKVLKQESEGAVSLIYSGEEILKAFETLTPSWYEEDQLHIPDVMMDYMETYPLFKDGKLTASRLLDSEAQAAGLADGSVAGCFADAYYIGQVLAANDAVKDGEWGLCYGPQQYADEAQVAAVTAACKNVDLAKELLLYLTCDEKAMKTFAEAQKVPVNHKDVMETLSKDDSGKLALLKNLNIYKSYTGAAKRMDIHEETDTEEFLRVMFLQEINSCIAGEKNVEEALDAFIARVESVL